MNKWKVAVLAVTAVTLTACSNLDVPDLQRPSLSGLTGTPTPAGIFAAVGGVLHQPVIDLLVGHGAVARLPAPSIDDENGDGAIVREKLGDLRFDIGEFCWRDGPVTNPLRAVPD